jgi:hypothetical protein
MPSDDWSHEETDDPGFADRRSFYKVEKWSSDGQAKQRLRKPPSEDHGRVP